MTTMMLDAAADAADPKWRMLSRTGEYALRVALHLGRMGAGARISASEAAAALEVPAKYMARVLNELAHTGLLVSVRGARGGFQLVLPAADLTLAMIVAPFDAVGEAPQCLLRNQLCGHGDACLAHREWQHVAGTVRQFFQNTTIADLLDPARNPAAAASAREDS